MTISDEQVAEIARALHESRLSNGQIRTLQNAFDRVHRELKVIYEVCMRDDPENGLRDVPESVRQPVSETIKDLGRLRDAFGEACLALTGDGGP